MIPCFFFASPFELDCYYEFSYNEKDLPFIAYKYTPNGIKTDNTVALEYYEDGVLKKWSAYDDGLLLSFAEYDELGRKIHQKLIYDYHNEKENIAFFEYDGDGRNMTDADMLVNGSSYYHLELEYDENSNLSEYTIADITGKKGACFEYYVESGLIRSCKGESSLLDEKGAYYLGNVTEISYKYSADGRLEEYLIEGDEIIDDKGADKAKIKRSFIYEDDRLISAEYAEISDYLYERTLLYTYDESGKKTSQTEKIKYRGGDIRNCIVKYEYDNDMLTRESQYEEGEENGNLSYLKSYEYDEKGRLERVRIEYPSYIIINEYDERGNLIRIKNLDGEKTYLDTEYKYDDKNNKIYKVSSEYFENITGNSRVMCVHENYYNTWGYCTLYRFVEIYDDGSKCVTENKYNSFGKMIDAGLYIKYDANGDIVFSDYGAKG